MFTFIDEKQTSKCLCPPLIFDTTSLVSTRAYQRNLTAALADGECSIFTFSQFEK